MNKISMNENVANDLKIFYSKDFFCRKAPSADNRLLIVSRSVPLVKNHGVKGL